MVVKSCSNGGDSGGGVCVSKPLSGVLRCVLFTFWYGYTIGVKEGLVKLYYTLPPEHVFTCLISTPRRLLDSVMLRLSLDPTVCIYIAHCMYTGYSVSVY